MHKEKKHKRYQKEIVEDDEMVVTGTISDQASPIIFSRYTVKLFFVTGKLVYELCVAKLKMLLQ